MTQNRQALAICGLLLLAVGLVFGQTVRYDFVNLDDDVCVSENPQVARGLTLQGIAWAFTNRLVGNWDPLTWISHMADWQLYGANAGGHHLTNVLLHGLAAVLLFLVLWKMTGRLGPCAFAAALFAVHPLRVESVAWVTERKDVLSGVLFMLTLAAYVAYVHRLPSLSESGSNSELPSPFGRGAGGEGPASQTRRTSFLRYLLVAVLFTVGLMTKPMLATLPCLLLVLDFWPLERMSVHPRRLARLVLEKLPLLIPVAACAAVTIWAQRVSEYEYGSWRWRIGNALISYVVYLRQFFWPTDLALLYPRRDAVLPLWQILGAAAILLAITTALVLLRRRCPYLLVGWLWYLGMLLPVVGFIPFGNQAPADRFTYLPQIGLAIAVAWGAADLCREWPRRRLACAAGSILILAPLMVCTWQQTSYWRDSLTLWTRSLACMPDNYRVHTMLGNALARRNRVDEAVEHFQKAVAIRSDYPEALYGLGVAAAERGQTDEAIARYQEALKANPTYANAHNNLGNLLLARGQIVAAIDHCQTAVEINPNLAEGYFNLGNALFVRRRLDDALTQYEKAIEADPNYADAYYNIGLIWATRGRIDRAVEQYRKAIELAPDFAEVHNSLGAALAASGHNEEAIAHYRRALVIRPAFVEARINLDRALVAPKSKP